MISITKEPVTESGILAGKHHQYKKQVTELCDFDKFLASDKFHYVCGWGIYYGKGHEQICMI
jgi:hypothetical protein